MELRDYRKSDFYIVLSRINTKLRDEYSNLEDLVRAEDLDLQDLTAFFAEHNYEYMQETNSYREK